MAKWIAYGASLRQSPQDPEHCFSGNRIHPYTYCKPVVPHPLSWPPLQSRDRTCVEKDTGTFLKRCTLQRHLNVATPKALLWILSWGNFLQSFVFEYAKNNQLGIRLAIWTTTLGWTWVSFLPHSGCFLVCSHSHPKVCNWWKFTHTTFQKFYIFGNADS